MRNYEIMYILKSDLDEEARKNANEELAKIITSNGGIELYIARVDLGS